MTKIQLSKLQTDISSIKRLPIKQIKKAFKNFSFVYTPDYQLSKLNHMASADKKYLPNVEVRRFYNALDYRLILHYNYEKSVIGGIIDLINYLVTSIDQKGMKSPVNLYKGTLHPGGKRLQIARYLNMNTIPVLEQIDKNNLAEGNVKNLKDLIEIYTNQISIQFNRDILEVSYHGESGHRDDKGYDSWYKASEDRNVKVDVRKYLITNGLEITNNFLEKTIVQDEFFISKFVKKPKNKIYIEVKNKELLKYNFWELFFHIDPLVNKKICSTKDIIIHNEYAHNPTLENCRLYKTLIRDKMYFQ